MNRSSTANPGEMNACDVKPGELQIEAAPMTFPDDTRIDKIRAELLDILEQLDALDLSQASAHLSMAIHCLEPGSFDCTAQGGTNSVN